LRVTSRGLGDVYKRQPFSGVFKKRVTVKFAGVKEVTELVIEGEVIL
jgi:hypothetical protein